MRPLLLPALLALAALVACETRTGRGGDPGADAGGSGGGPPGAAGCETLPVRHEAYARFAQEVGEAPLDAWILEDPDLAAAFVPGDPRAGEEPTQDIAQVYPTREALTAVGRLGAMRAAEMLEESNHDWSAGGVLLAQLWPRVHAYRRSVEGDTLVVHVGRASPCPASALDSLHGHHTSVRTRAYAAPPGVSRVELREHEVAFRMPFFREDGSCRRAPDRSLLQGAGGFQDVIRDGDGYLMIHGGVFDEAFHRRLSSDGIAWNVHDRVTLDSPDRDDFHHPAIVTDGDGYLLLYAHHEWQEPEGRQWQIRAARSDDAVHFTSERVVLEAAEDEVAVTMPSVLRRGDELWLYHLAQPYDAPSHVKLAVSTDGGETWSPRGVVLEPGPPGSWDELNLYSPRAVESGGRVHLVYVGGHGGADWDEHWRSAIGVASSPDGIHFERRPLPLLVGTRERDGWSVGAHGALAEPAHLTIWYTGFDGDVFDPIWRAECDLP